MDRLVHRLDFITLFPQSFGNLERINIEILPPGRLVSRLMNLPMVPTAEWYGKLIADFQPQCSGLGEAKVVRI